MLPNDTIGALTSVRLTSESRLLHLPQDGRSQSFHLCHLLPIHDSEGALEERFAPVAQELF
jgi:hypothetical protein